MIRKFVPILLVFLLFASQVAMANEANIWVVDETLVIECPGNSFANIVHPLNLEKEPEELIVEMQVMTEGTVGSMWAPGIGLYWDQNRWMMLRKERSVFRMHGYIQEKETRVDQWPITPSSGWNGLKLIWRGETLGLYASNETDNWQHLMDIPRPGNGLPWLIVGKGFSGSQVYPVPYLANSYQSPGSMGTSYIKDIKVIADGVVLLEENFKDNILDEETWIPLIDGNPKLDDKIEVLNTLRERQREISLASDLFSLTNWETWRDKCQRTSGLYKEEFIEIAKKNIKSSSSGKKALDIMKNEVALVMSYDKKQIKHMIPETTPTSHMFNPSPLSDLGYPHGAWIWSPEKPDEIICQETGRVFPNKDFPEDIVLVANYGGKEQRFTFHRSKDWTFAGFPLATSFTGTIRARKVYYMAEQVEKLGILYALTEEEEYARQAKAILLRFAEVFPYYLVHSGYQEFADMDPIEAARNISNLPQPELVVPPNVPNGQLHKGYWMAGRFNGNGADGQILTWITNGYALIADSKDSKGSPFFTEEEKIIVERDLLLEGTRLLLCDEEINNKTIAARTAVALVGAVVGDPILVRWGYDGFLKFLNGWFLSDGTTSETPTYGLMVLKSMWQLGEILYGYSDPQEYTDALGDRFDNLNVYELPKYRAIWQNLYLSLLSNTYFPPIGDTSLTDGFTDDLLDIAVLRYDYLPEFKTLLKAKMQTAQPSLFYRDFSMDLKKIGPMIFPDVLFPVWRQVFLRNGDGGRDAAAILNVSNWGNHYHYDSLNLIYWKDGSELLSDLGYLWDSPDSMMTVRSVAHNLVVVDELNQSPLRGGDILLYNPLGRFKVTEGSSKAYPQTSMYRRYIAQIDHPGENSYLVDIFRVKGGTIHDYVYHGPGTSFAYKGISLSNSDTNLSNYKFTNVREGSSENWYANFWSFGGSSKTFQAMAVDAKDEKVLVADGWGKRNTKANYTTLPFFIRRRTGQDLESCFVSIFEGSKSNRSVENASLIALDGDPRDAVCVTTNVKSYTDYILSSIDKNRITGKTDHGLLSFQGTSGVASFKNTSGGLFSIFSKSKEELEILGVIDGNELNIGNWGISIKEEPLSGKILKAYEDGFSIEGTYPELSQYVGWDIFVINPKMQTAYPIRKVEVKDGVTKIYTIDKTSGFPFEEGTTWYLPRVAYMERQEKNEYIVKGTGEIEICAPKDAVSKKLAYHLGDGRWKEISTLDKGDSVTFTLSPGEGGQLFLRLK